MSCYIKRLRQWLEANELPLSIEENESTYRLSFTGPLVLIVSIDRPTASFCRSNATRYVFRKAK